MDNSYFAVSEEWPDGGRYVAGPATSGPWEPDLQHGGPPSALAVVVAERALAAATGRDDFLALRLAADFIGPVPVGEISARARVLRAARSAALVEAILAAGGRDCLLGRIWFVRDSDTAALAQPLGPAAEIPHTRSTLDYSFGYGNSLEWRFVHGRMGTPGPAAAWVCAARPVLAGREMSGLARVALIADSGSGISAELDWGHWSFLNVDLDVHLARPVQGDWILMDAATQLGAHGSALARSTLSDVYGPIGSGLQTLIVAPRKRR